MDKLFKNAFYYYANVYILKFLRHFVTSRIFKKFQYNFYDKCGVKIQGNPEFISLTAKFDTSGNILISDRVVISDGVVILTHDYSISNAYRAVNCEKNGLPFVGDVVIGTNSFIGLNSIIMPGVEIGKNSVIAAGSVVTSTVDDDTIVAGVPARPIGKINRLITCVDIKNKNVRLPNKNARFISLST